MKTEGVVVTQTKPRVAGAVRMLRWWMMHCEVLTDGGYQWSRSTRRAYVGMHTPDTDPVSIHTYALGAREMSGLTFEPEPRSGI